MKLYCYLCQDLFDEANFCPKCHITRLRPVGPTDPVLLAKVPAMRAELLGPLLEDEGIPFMHASRRANLYGMNTMGWPQDLIHIYVPFEKLEAARDMLTMLENSYENEAAEAAEDYESEE